MISRSLLEGHPAEVAPRVLGALLVSDIGSRTAVRITEVEAYAQDDAASHSFRGRTQRNGAMFGPAGTLYVYRSYGIHWCANVVTGLVGEGAALLIRAGIPVEGESLMADRRGRNNHVSDGPGKLTQALAIDGSLDNADLLDPASPVRLEGGEGVRETFTTSPRVGITKAVDARWRFRVGSGPT